MSATSPRNILWSSYLRSCGIVHDLHLHIPLVCRYTSQKKVCSSPASAPWNCLQHYWPKELGFLNLPHTEKEVRGKMYKTREMILRCVAEKRQVHVSAVASECFQGYGLGVPLTKTQASCVSTAGISQISMNVHSESFPDCPAWRSVRTWWCWVAFIHSKYLRCHFHPSWDCSTCDCPCRGLKTGRRVLRVLCAWKRLFLSRVCLTGYLWQVRTYAAICKQQYCLSLETFNMYLLIGSIFLHTSSNLFINLLLRILSKE